MVPYCNIVGQSEIDVAEVRQGEDGADLMIAGPLTIDSCGAEVIVSLSATRFKFNGVRYEDEHNKDRNMWLRPQDVTLCQLPH